MHHAKPLLTPFQEAACNAWGTCRSQSFMSASTACTVPKNAGREATKKFSGSALAIRPMESCTHDILTYRAACTTALQRSSRSAGPHRRNSRQVCPTDKLCQVQIIVIVTEESTILHVCAKALGNMQGSIGLATLRRIHVRHPEV
jgi:hypothetical protein